MVYKLMAGLFRIRGLNSLLVQVGTLEAIKVRHSGDVTEKVIGSTYKALKSLMSLGRSTHVHDPKPSQLNSKHDRE